MSLKPRLSFLATLAMAALLAGFQGCASPSPAPDAASASPTADVDPPPEGTPRLVLILTVDQLRGDYLDRFAPLFEHGLKRLVDEGVVFTDAHHGHAVTYTAPGHAALSTGRHPSRNGIVANTWWDRDLDDWVYSVEPPGGDEGPGNLLSDSLGDWLKARYPASKVIAASVKDRSAVLLGGAAADAVYWYDRDHGGFESSDTYPELPQWLETFNAARHLDVHLGEQWSPEPLPGGVEERALGVVGVDLGPFVDRFPHAFGGVGVGQAFYGQLRASPFVDQQLGRLARSLIEEEKLGADTVPDLLALSFSALDSVGHTYGPNSREVVETLRHLDRTLGELLAFVDQQVGREHVVVALSSDHGVVTVPEVAPSVGVPGGRLGAAEILCVQQAEAALDAAFGAQLWLEQGLYLDRDVVAASGADPKAVEAAVVTHLESCPSVEAVWTLASAAAAPEDDPMASLFRSSLHPHRSPDFFIQWQEGFLPSRSIATSHGSPYVYDTHVPLIFRAPSWPSQRRDERVLTVDLAPTLATLLGLEVPSDLDGVDRSP